MCSTKKIKTISSPSLNANEEAINEETSHSIRLSLQQKRRIYLVMVISLPLILLMALIVESYHIMEMSFVQLEHLKNTERQVSATIELGQLLVAIQRERVETALYFYSDNNKSRSHFNTNYTSTDEIFNKIRRAMCDNDFVNLTQRQLANFSNFRSNVIGIASKESNMKSHALEKVLRSYVVSHNLLEDMSERIDRMSNNDLWRTMIAYNYISRVIEHITFSAVFGVEKCNDPTLSMSSFSTFVQNDILSKEYLLAINHFVPNFMGKVIFEHWEKNLRRDREIRENGQNLLDNKRIFLYYTTAVNFFNELREKEMELIIIIREQLSEQMIIILRKQVVVIGIFIIISIISVIFFFSVKHMTIMIDKYANNMYKVTRDLRKEKKKSDHLLFQMLPSRVVNQLKQKKQVVAENFDSVTIFFSDIIDFTNLSANSTPMEIVNMLNALYRIFDSKIRKYDVYKVETIGDSYMVVSGLPVKNGNRHASEIAMMSLDILASTRSFKIPHRPTQKLMIRIGLNTGPCVAGVVGTTMPRFCLFGDTINTASRMESTGESMRIHISQSTKDLLVQEEGYEVELRGSLDVKGKGMMKTYWLVGKNEYNIDSQQVDDDAFFIPGEVIQPEFIHMISSTNEIFCEE